MENKSQSGSSYKKKNGRGIRGKRTPQQQQQDPSNKAESANVLQKKSASTKGKKVAPSHRKASGNKVAVSVECRIEKGSATNKLNSGYGKNDTKSDGGHGGKHKSNVNADSRYPPHWSNEKCLRLYAAKDPNLIRGKLRALPSKDGFAFCACDRGSLKRDVAIETLVDRNRGMNGDIVFVELLPQENEEEEDEPLDIGEKIENLQLGNNDENHAEMWQDDEVQMQLWNPVVPIRRIKKLNPSDPKEGMLNQRKGRVVHVCAPALPPDAPKGAKPTRYMVGTLKTLQSGTCLFTPNDRLLPQFKCENNMLSSSKIGSVSESTDLYKAEYVYGSYREMHKWPPCRSVKKISSPLSIEGQIQGLLLENQVNHGEFPPDVLKDVDNAVQSGVYLMDSSIDGSAKLGWKPTPEMYEGRRDFRQERIFTIDPTTAKDLDDALHIKKLPDGTVELGVHIADVSAFVTPGSAVDQEALRRATTVYLVDRTVPMLPRPLCEIACSLNENVERLAFSCVWRMNLDGSLAKHDVWYGRTVIRSCARLDYGTAQNIIDKKVGIGEKESEMDDKLWPKSRRPTGGHSIEGVAADVRLMHRVAMARRRLRFSNGALALHGVKLTFQLDDTNTPMRCAPYPIKDSNRLVEEYMLLANYLVAQRLITHAGERAVLRRHPDPQPLGLDKVCDVGKALFDFEVDASSSAALHASLVRFEAECKDEVVQKCMTQMLTAPMQNADYFAAGAFPEELWRHFALNIPYYTHYSSPIRRYADVLVHRLLQATIDGSEAVNNFPLDSNQLNAMCEHCNEKKLASKMAQERCDVIFLALYLRKHPMKSELGVVMSLGNKAITVFVPSLGVNAMLFLDEHQEWLEHTSNGEGNNKRLIVTTKSSSAQSKSWKRIEIKMFTKLLVSCLFKDKPRVDVKLELEGPAPHSMGLAA